MTAFDTCELALGELDQASGGRPDFSAGPAPIASAVIVTAAVAGIGFAVGVAIGRAIKGEE
jgi:hypothetical protein